MSVISSKGRRSLDQRGYQRIRKNKPLPSLDAIAPSQVAVPIPYSNYCGNPAGFIEDVLEFRLTPEQKAIAQSIVDNEETNVQASHGLGKTFLGAALVLYWVFAVGGVAVTTAPTGRQVKTLLWGEIRKAYDRHRNKLGGDRAPKDPQLQLSEYAKAWGFSTEDRNVNAFQGLHDRKLLIIEDEACGITQEIDDGASSCLTGSGNRMLRIGNPVLGGTPFEKSCKASALKIPVWSHPNVEWAYEVAAEDSAIPTAIAPHGIKSGERYLKPEVARAILEQDHTGKWKPKALEHWPEPYQSWGDRIPGAVSVHWIEKIRREKGEKSAYWASRVNAEFPGDIAQSIIPRSLFTAAKARYTEPKIDPQLGYRLGLDVGDGGDDSAIAIWYSNTLLLVDILPGRGDGLDNDNTANWAWNYLKRYPGLIAVDKVGVGAGVYSKLLNNLRTRKHELPPQVRSGVWGVSFGEKSTGISEVEAFNLKADWYWKLREEFMSGTVAIAPVNIEFEERLQNEFALTFYEEDLKDKTRIEPKTKTRSRLGHSPDLADAVVMGYNAKAATGYTDAKVLLDVLS